MKSPTKYRTHTCAELRPADLGKAARLAGFAEKSADEESFELRDRHGKTMVVLGPGATPEMKALAAKVKDEDVVAATGVVAQRIERDPSQPSGEIYLVPRTIEILSDAEPLPPGFRSRGAAAGTGAGAGAAIGRATKEGDLEARLRFRTLDLRRPAMQRRMALRSRALAETRNYLTSQEFLEIETPYLGRWTPEAVNAFLVPGKPGRCYALPETNTPFKQLLVASGFDRTFQVARLFRNEHASRLGPLRQPEFTAIEIEAAFVEEDDLFAIADGLVAQVYGAVAGGRTDRKLETPLRKIPYELSLTRYGTDRPDLRVGMDVIDLGKVAMGWPVPLFRDALGEGNGVLRAFKVSGAGERLPPDELNKLGTQLRRIAPADVTWIKADEPPAKISGPIAKFFEDAGLRKAMLAATGASQNDVIVFVCGRSLPAATAVLGEARARIAEKTGQAAPDRVSALWINEVPFFRTDPATGTPVPHRHPFLRPREEDRKVMAEDKHRTRSMGFDLVVNGVKVGSGGIRNHDVAMQDKVFAMFEYPPEEVQRRFGFVMDAMRFGMPPHGGVTIGVDRLLAALLNLNDVSEVMAFPKAVLPAKATGVPEIAIDLMTGAPNEVDAGYVKKLVGG